MKPELFYELNTANLGLISMMQKLPEQTPHAWEETLSHAGHTGVIRCEAMPKYGLPHGIDGDTISALHTLYILSGSTDGKLQTSGAEVLRLMGFKTPSQPYYERLEQSLERLHYAHYSLDAHWFSAEMRHHTSAKFNALSSLTIDRTSHLIDANKRGMSITVQLHECIYKNLSASHVLRINPKHLVPLNSTSARAFYRLIEGLRYHGPQAADELTLYSSSLKQRGRIFGNQKPSRVRRYFEPAIEILKQTGYLQRADISQQRGETVYHFKFGDIRLHYNTTVLQALAQAGVWPDVARKIAERDLPEDQVLDLIQAAIDEQQAGRIGNLGAYLRTALLPLESADDLIQYTPPRTAQRVPAKTTTTTSEPKPDKDDIERASLGIVSALSEKYGLSPAQGERLRDALSSGQLAAAQLTEYVTGKKAQQTEKLHALLSTL